MNNLKLYVLYFACSISVNASSQIDLRDSAIWVAEKVIEARGGRDYLSTIQTFYAEMRTEEDGAPVTWITKEQKPNRGLLQIVKNGKVVFDSWFDGKNRYYIVDGVKKEEDEPGSTVAQLARKNIFTELDYVDTTLWTLGLFADEKVNSTECFKLKGTFIEGSQRFVYVDKKTFRIIKEERLDKYTGKPVQTSYYSEFKKFGKFIFYTRVLFVYPDYSQEVHVTKVLIDEGVSDADFAR
ncbi:MAG: hypothetical protein EOO45_03925 [Flavobacterium sp.]|nr:MAG: hypothetical protein EOO45_03925 [Flavobacterium sp.]